MLRPIRREDVLTLHRIWIDEEVRRFLGMERSFRWKRPEAIVERSDRLFDDVGYGLWGVHELACDELIGFAEYWHFSTHALLAGALFGVKSGRWNCGITTESGQSVIRYGFETLKLSSGPSKHRRDQRRLDSGAREARDVLAATGGRRRTGHPFLLAATK